MRPLISRPASPGAPAVDGSDRPALPVTRLTRFRDFLEESLPPGGWEIVTPGERSPGSAAPVEHVVTVRLTGSHGMHGDGRVPIPGAVDVGAVDVEVVLAERLSAADRARLEERGSSYWEESGRALLQHQSPAVWVRVSRDQPERRPHRSSAYQELRGEAIAELICALVGQATVPSVHEVARQAGVSVATASRALQLLRQAVLLPATDRPLETSTRAELLRLWGARDGHALRPEVRRYRARSVSEPALRSLAEQGVPFAVSGTWAYCLYRGMEPEAEDGRDLWLYSPAPVHVAEQAGLTLDVLDGGVRLAPRGRRAVTSDRLVGGVPLVSPWRVAADLLSAGGHHAALGALLLRHVTEGSCDVGVPAVERM